LLAVLAAAFLGGLLFFSVGATDFSILKGTFGKSVGQPGYDARADFNSDGAIGSVDFASQKSNFGQSATSLACP